MTDKMLLPIQELTTLDSFKNFVEESLRGHTGFHVCAAFVSEAGTEFAFFTPSDGDGPDAAYRTIAALVVAAKARRVFVGYAANLEPILGSKFGDLGRHQAIFFTADSKSSHPYEFCKLVLLDGDWRIEHICILSEEDENSQIFMSDIYQYVAEQSAEYISVARKSIEEWRPDLNWEWSSYD
jgi:hypothetical protein